MAWIRSQDGNRLVNVNAIWIDIDNFLRGETTPIDDGSLGWMLGKFKDETTALEEMGRIDIWLCEGGTGVYRVSPE